MTIKCIAVDDEPLALAKIVDYIDQVPFLQLCGQFENGLNALTFLQENQVDLIFLDIQMPRILGTQLLKILNKQPQVIFTTAYSEYAIEGFELNVTDYLLKPIGFSRFLQAAQKAMARMPGHQAPPAATESPAGAHQPDFVFVKTETRLQKVVLADIRYIEGLKDYLSIYTNTERILILMNFQDLLARLGEDFVRIHKSYAVPVFRIDAIEKARLKIGNQLLPIGETYRKAFIRRLERFNVDSGHGKSSS